MSSNKENTKNTLDSKIADQKAAISKLNSELDTKSVEERVMLVVFPVGEEEYAVEIDQVKEVVPAPQMAPIPQTEDFVLGVANVRGNVLAILDLAVKFGLKEVKEVDHSEDNHFVIVIKSEDIHVAVSSLQVPETLLIDKKSIDSSMDVMKKRSGEQGHIKGIIKIENRMIILIDILEMVQNEQVVK